MIVVGDKEKETDTITLRMRGNKQEFGVKLDDFIARIKEEIKQ
ncbi:MAG: His/Gly/Thr/Pro-type tRNA ligase C-terminal domain-containing protein [Christensenellales bacterium]